MRLKQITLLQCTHLSGRDPAGRKSALPSALAGKMLTALSSSSVPLRTGEQDGWENDEITGSFCFHY